MTLFPLDADLLLMMHPYARFDYPTMYSSWDMKSDINSNVSCSSGKCGSQWPNFPWMLTYYPWCIHTPGLIIPPRIDSEIWSLTFKLDVNSNTSHSSRKCGSQWLFLTWMLTYFPWCILTPGLMILQSIVPEIWTRTKKLECGWHVDAGCTQIVPFNLLRQTNEAVLQYSNHIHLLPST